MDAIGIDRSCDLLGKALHLPSIYVTAAKMGEADGCALFEEASWIRRQTGVDLESS